MSGLDALAAQLQTLDPPYPFHAAGIVRALSAGAASVFRPHLAPGDGPSEAGQGHLRDRPPTAGPKLKTRTS